MRRERTLCRRSRWRRWRRTSLKGLPAVEVLVGVLVEVLVAVPVAVEVLVEVLVP